MPTLSQALRMPLWLACAGLLACVDPHDPAKERPPTDDGPGSAEAAANEARAGLSAKARQPGMEETETPAAELPLPEDFEDEAAEQIGDENYEAELDALEKELAEEP